MDKGSSLDGFNALFDGSGNSASTVFESVTTKCVVEDELVQIVHNHGGKPFKEQILGQIGALWPHDLLKQLLLDHAEEFVRQIAAQRFVPLTNVHQFLVWGPYAEKVGPPRDWVPEEGNHLIKQPRKAARVWGYQGDEFDWRKGCAFLIQGTFTRDAKHGFVDEQTGVLIV